MGKIGVTPGVAAHNSPLYMYSNVMQMMVFLRHQLVVIGVSLLVKEYKLERFLF